ncbi:MAG: hypothetical protein PHH77_03875 [Victivallaceae bacterium]|nr:hypothetical protein [Victivallaceae bacterium]
MKTIIYLYLFFLSSVICLSAMEIGIDTDPADTRAASITPRLSAGEEADITGLSHFGASLLIKDVSHASDHLLAALAENPHSSRILAFLLANFRNYQVPNRQLTAFIAVARVNPRALPLNIAALTLADYVKPSSGSTLDLKQRLAENCVAANDPDTFDEIQFDFFHKLVKMLSAIYLQRKQYAKGDELFDRLFTCPKLYQHDIFLQQAVIFYAQAALDADKSRRFFWLLPSPASRYAARKQELLQLLYARSNKTAGIEQLIKHLTLLQKLKLFDEAKSLLFEQLAKQPAKLVLQVALAELFSKQEKYSLAAAVWKKMVKNNPKNELFRLKLAENAFRARLYSLAVENYRLVLQASPPDKAVPIVFMLILSELQLGEPEVARELLNMLPHAPRFMELRARVLSAAGNDKQAFEILSALILNSPRRVDKQLYLFWLALAVRTQSPETQWDCLKTAKENLDLKDVDVANSIGYTYADLNRNLPEAEKLIVYACGQKPERPEYLDSMAWILFRLRRFKPAAVYIEKAIARDGAYPNAVLASHAGDIFNALADRKQALHYWRLALKIFCFDLNRNDVINKIKQLERQ